MGVIFLNLFAVSITDFSFLFDKRSLSSDNFSSSRSDFKNRLSGMKTGGLGGYIVSYFLSFGGESLTNLKLFISIDFLWLLLGSLTPFRVFSLLGVDVALALPKCFRRASIFSFLILRVVSCNLVGLGLCLDLLTAGVNGD